MSNTEMKEEIMFIPVIRKNESTHFFSGNKLYNTPEEAIAVATEEISWLDPGAARGYIQVTARYELYTSGENHE